jgi:hypothetical protein
VDSNSGIYSVDLLIDRGCENYIVEDLAKAQIQEEWGEITYKLQSILHVHRGPLPIENDAGAHVAEIEVDLYLVYFKLMH